MSINCCKLVEGLIEQLPIKSPLLLLCIKRSTNVEKKKMDKRSGITATFIARVICGCTRRVRKIYLDFWTILLRKSTFSCDSPCCWDQECWCHSKAKCKLNPANASHSLCAYGRLEWAVDPLSCQKKDLDDRLIEPSMKYLERDEPFFGDIFCKVKVFLAFFIVQ